jgi:hypothetical protein
VEEPGAGGADSASQGVGPMRVEIVHDYDVARLQSRNQTILDFAVDRPVNDHGAVMRS